MTTDPSYLAAQAAAADIGDWYSTMGSTDLILHPSTIQEIEAVGGIITKHFAPLLAAKEQELERLRRELKGQLQP